jgi:RNA polymerase-binding transcription factor DksA
MDARTARKRLERERERLQSILDGSVDGLSIDSQEGAELSTLDQHPGDQGTELFEREQALSIATHAEGAIAEVDDALGRLEEGTYGRCQVCGAKITRERLEARPETRFCLEHQQEAERTG